MNVNEAMVRKLRRELDLEYSKSRDALKALLIDIEAMDGSQSLTVLPEALVDLRKNLRRVLESGS